MLEEFEADLRLRKYVQKPRQLPSPSPEWMVRQQIVDSKRRLYVERAILVASVTTLADRALLGQAFQGFGCGRAVRLRGLP